MAEIDNFEVMTIKDSTHDRQPGVYEAYNGKADWLGKTIERLAEEGWHYKARLEDIGLTIFERPKPKETIKPEPTNEGEE